jgi:transcriptional regulator with XRE-family HTH domain
MSMRTMQTPALYVPPESIGKFTIVKTIDERVLHMMDLRGLGFNELDRSLGKAQGYTSRLVRNERSPRVETIERLTKVLRVRAEWLLSGTGDIELATDMEADSDTYPNRARAAQIARLDGFSEQAIARVRQVTLQSGHDLRVTEWLLAIRAEHELRDGRGSPFLPEPKPAERPRRAQRPRTKRGGDR